MAVLAYVLRFYIPMVFTTDRELITYTARLLQIVAVFVLLEGIGGVGVGIVRGTGRQTLGAVIIFVCYYAIALPVGITLMFATSLGLSGLWWGYVLGLALQDVCLLTFMARVDWDKEAAKAQQRAGLARPEDSVNCGDTRADDETHTPPDETTTLLPSAEGATAVSPNVPWGQIIIRRLSVCLLFLLVLVAGILCHVYVHVKPR
ncbi:Multidrug and toxin extrusion protein 1 [Lamellibrachia satsuma]|nr:Multidrug and toxin extrusion protein 1 [Lamellibrachia satsuma]